MLSGTGGAQFGLGESPDLDLIVVFAEAFIRDATLDDFSLAAIIAHERGSKATELVINLRMLLGELE